MTLLSGDMDFVPAVEAAVALGIDVTILGSTRSTSRELIWQRITLSHLPHRLFSISSCRACAPHDFLRTADCTVTFPTWKPSWPAGQSVM